MMLFKKDNNFVDSKPVLLFVLLTVTAISPFASQARATINDSDAWNIRMFTAQQADGIPFCAISKEFMPEGYTIYISQNPMDDLKIVVSSGKDRYISGKSYFLEIKVGSVSKKIQSVIPENNTFSISIAANDPIRASLAVSDRVEMIVDEKKILFDSNMLPDAMKDLNACIQGKEMREKGSDSIDLYSTLAQPKSSDADIIRNYQKNQTLLLGQGQVVPAVQSSKLSIDEQELLESLKSKISILEREKEALRNTLVSERQSNLSSLKTSLDSNGELQQCQTQASIMYKQIEELQKVKIDIKKCDVNTPATKTLEAVSQIVDAEQKNLSDPAIITDLQQANVALENEITMLKSQLGEKEKKTVVDANVKDKDTARLQDAYQDAHKAEKSNHFHEQNALRAEIDKLNSLLQNARIENQSLQTELASERSQAKAVPKTVECPVPELTGDVGLMATIRNLQKVNSAYEKQLRECQ